MKSKMATDQVNKRTNLKLSFAPRPAGSLSFTSPAAAADGSGESGTSRPTSATSATSVGSATSSRSFIEGTGYPTQMEKLYRSTSLPKTGKLVFSADEIYDFCAEDLQDIGEIGRGNFGTVNKVVHEKSNTTMAVKRIRSTVEEKEQKELLMDLAVVMNSNECPYIVKFFGALFKEGDCWICMELMDVSLDKFYRYVYKRQESRIPEPMLRKITFATVKALDYLKDKLEIIHRDVKPSNILMDRKGNIKLCDFGISGHLVDSIAKTQDAGCRPYMAPERINPNQNVAGYDVRADVWSLGITLYELATGNFPYKKWNSVFDQLTQVVQGDAPQLDMNDSNFSTDFVTFVNRCLTKNHQTRPKYKQLLIMPFIRRQEDWDVSTYINTLLDEMPPDFTCEPAYLE